METPILFLTFNRPTLTRRVFDEIKEVKPRRLYVAIDGPRIGNLSDQLNIDKVLKIVNDISWDCELKVLKRESNIGCGLAVSNAIDWFFSQEDEGIILEDDCVPSQDFFFFCELMLKKYRHDSRVMAINGSNPLGEIQSSFSYFFSKYNLVWGWATWKRSWRFYEFDLSRESNFKRLINLLKSFKFDLVSVKSWYKHLNLVSVGKINTWDYQWLYACWKFNGLVVTPSVNLICNVGNEFEPTNGFVDADYLNLQTFKLQRPIIDADEVRRNIQIDQEFAKFRFGNTILQFIKAKLKKNSLWE